MTKDHKGNDWECFKNCPQVPGSTKYLPDSEFKCKKGRGYDEEYAKWYHWHM